MADEAREKQGSGLSQSSQPITKVLSRRRSSRGATAGRLWHDFSVLLIFLPIFQILLLLQAIWSWTSNVPYWDEWETLELIRHTRQGQLRFAELWIVHNEHRIVVPRLISLALISATNWNRQVEMTFNILVVIGSALLFLDCARRMLHTRGALLILGVLISGLLLSFSQFENWFAPFQISFFATVFGVACSMWALYTLAGRWSRFALAIVGALIASLSSLAGLMVWPAFFIMALRTGRWKGLAWVISGLAIVFAYFINFPQTPRGAISLRMLLSYFIAYLGAPIGFPDLLLAQVLALGSVFVLLINLVAYWFMKQRLDDMLIWLCLGLFALACAAITSVGRGAALGTAQALGSRYHAFSSLWWVAFSGVIVLTTSRIVDRIGRSRERDKALIMRQAVPYINVLVLVAIINGALLLPVALSFVKANIAGFDLGLTTQLNQRQHEYCIAAYERASDSCLTTFYPIAQLVRQKAAYLDSEGLALFHNQPTTPFSRLRLAQPATPASIEAVAGVNVENDGQVPIVVPHGRTLVVQGWAIDIAAATPGSSVWIAIDDTFNFRAEYGIERKDIAEALRLPNATSSGFQAIIPPGLLLPGKHQLTIKVVSADQLSYYRASQSVDFLVQGFSYAPGVNVLPQIPMGDLVQGLTFSQTFTSRCDRLSQIDLLLAIYGRKNTVPVTFRLIDLQTGSTVFAQELPSQLIADNKFQSLLFEPIAASNGKRYQIIMESPEGRPGNAITAWRSTGDLYPEGDSFQNTQPLGGDIAFRYGCAE